MKKLLTISVLLLLFGCKKDQAESQSESQKLLPIEKSHKERAYTAIMKAQNLTLEEIGDCDESSANDTIHKKEVAYLESQTISDEEIKANFGLVAACCKKFMGEYKTDRDTLTFTYENVVDEDCKCTCWHRYRLSIKNPPVGVKGLKFLRK
ncbi:hypothetical protein [Flavobacterium sp.]|uniref:hypothetical protein n=1 Tax=Flavobacterium sp. TaxID=239 RepID=UPI0011FBACA7|nr:hypothetical protein [Flavobacterium sp.]RZJ71636.1 MAG: hypothetical protein EOO49_09785 [Flavobacterium sp.]